jgi:hypothetical protein
MRQQSREQMRQQSREQMIQQSRGRGGSNRSEKKSQKCGLRSTRMEGMIGPSASAGSMGNPRPIKLKSGLLVARLFEQRQYRHGETNALAIAAELGESVPMAKGVLMATLKLHSNDDPTKSVHKWQYR